MACEAQTLSQRIDFTNTDGESFNEMINNDLNFLFDIQESNIDTSVPWTIENIKKALNTCFEKTIKDQLAGEDIKGYESINAEIKLSFYRHMRLYPMAFMPKPQKPMGAIHFIKSCADYLKTRRETLEKNLARKPKTPHSEWMKESLKSVSGASAGAGASARDFEQELLGILEMRWFKSFKDLNSIEYDFGIHPFSGIPIYKQMELIYHTLLNPRSTNQLGPSIALSFPAKSDKLNRQLMDYMDRSTETQEAHTTFIAEHPMLAFLAAGVSNTTQSLEIIEPYLNKKKPRNLGSFNELVEHYYGLGHLKGYDKAMPLHAAELFFFFFHGNVENTRQVIEWMRAHGTPSLQSRGYFILASNVAQVLGYSIRNKKSRPEKHNFCAKFFGRAPAIPLYPMITDHIEGRVQLLLTEFCEKLPAPRMEDLQYLLPFFHFPEILQTWLHKFPDLPHRELNIEQFNFKWCDTDSNIMSSAIKKITMIELLILHFRLILLPLTVKLHASTTNPLEKEFIQENLPRLKEQFKGSFKQMLIAIGQNPILLNAPTLIIKNILELLEIKMLDGNLASIFFMQIGLPVLLSEKAILDDLHCYDTESKIQLNGEMVDCTVSLYAALVLFPTLSPKDKMDVAIHWCKVYQNDPDNVYTFIAQKYICEHPELLTLRILKECDIHTFNFIVRKGIFESTPTHMQKIQDDRKAVVLFDTMSDELKYALETLKAIPKEFLYNLLESKSNPIDIDDAPEIESAVRAQIKVLQHKVKLITEFGHKNQWLVIPIGRSHFSPTAHSLVVVKNKEKYIVIEKSHLSELLPKTPQKTPSHKATRPAAAAGAGAGAGAAASREPDTSTTHSKKKTKQPNISKKVLARIRANEEKRAQEAQKRLKKQAAKAERETQAKERELMAKEEALQKAIMAQEKEESKAQTAAPASPTLSATSTESNASSGAGSGSSGDGSFSSQSARTSPPPTTPQSSLSANAAVFRPSGKPRQPLPQWQPPLPPEKPRTPQRQYFSLFFGFDNCFAYKTSSQSPEW